MGTGYAFRPKLAEPLQDRFIAEQPYWKGQPPPKLLAITSSKLRGFEVEAMNSIDKFPTMSLQSTTIPTIEVY